MPPWWRDRAGMGEASNPNRADGQNQDPTSRSRNWQFTETEIYLRMLHLSDGKEAGARRAAIAHQCVRQFGIATECAFGRPEEYAIPPF
jgi:hypothetical protein